MSRPRASTILRRFLAGASTEQLADMCGSLTDLEALYYVENCIRRGLRGEVTVPRARPTRSKR